MGKSDRRELTDRQTAFCGEFLIDMIGTRAAIRAGYSAHRADAAASRLLRDERINAEIARRMHERNEKVGVDSQWVLRRLVELADVDLAGLVNEGGSIKELSEMPTDLKRLIAGFDVSEEFQGHGSDREKIGYTKKIRLSDRLRVLELIGKHTDVGAFVEKVEVNRGEDMVELILAARKRVQKAAAARAGQTSDDDEDDGEILH